MRPFLPILTLLLVSAQAGLAQVSSMFSMKNDKTLASTIKHRYAAWATVLLLAILLPVEVTAQDRLFQDVTASPALLAPQAQAHLTKIQQRPLTDDVRLVRFLTTPDRALLADAGVRLDVSSGKSLLARTKVVEQLGNDSFG